MDEQARQRSSAPGSGDIARPNRSWAILGRWTALGGSALVLVLAHVEENDLAAREFQCVVMTYGVLSVDLSKDRCPVSHYALSRWQGGPTPNVVSE